MKHLDFPFLQHLSFMSKQKDKNELLLRMLTSSLITSFIIQQTLCPLKKNCDGIYPSPLIRENPDFYSHQSQYQTNESSFPDRPFTVVFNPIKNTKHGIFSQTKRTRDKNLPCLDSLVNFLKNLQ